MIVCLQSFEITGLLFKDFMRVQRVFELLRELLLLQWIFYEFVRVECVMIIVSLMRGWFVVCVRLPRCRCRCISCRGSGGSVSGIAVISMNMFGVFVPLMRPTLWEILVRICIHACLFILCSNCCLSCSCCITRGGLQLICKSLMGFPPLIIGLDIIIGIGIAIDIAIHIHTGIAIDIRRFQFSTVRSLVAILTAGLCFASSRIHCIVVYCGIV